MKKEKTTLVYSNTITGIILDANTENGLANITVEAWEQDIKYPDLVDKVITDNLGHFTMQVDEKKWKDNAKDKEPRIFFKVYDAKGKLLRDTRDEVYWTTCQQDNPVAIAIGQKACTITGSVKHVDGRAAVQVKMQAYFKGTKQDELAGEAITGFDGAYTIAYTPRPSGNHLCVKIPAAGSRSKFTAESDTHYKVNGNLVIDFLLPAGVNSGLSEYELVELKLVTELEGMPVDAVDPKTWPLLADKLGIADAQLRKYMYAIALTKKYPAIVPAVFYALLHNDAATPADVFMHSKAGAVRILTNAVDTHVIPNIPKAGIDNYAAAYSAIYITTVKEDPAKATSIKLLALGGIDVKKLGLLADKTAIPVTLSHTQVSQWATEGIVNATQQQDLADTIGLHALAGSNIVFTTLLKSKYGNLRSLVGLDATAWTDLLKKNKIALPENHTHLTYGAALAKTVGAIYPSQSLMETVVRKKDANTAANMDLIKPLFAGNPQIFNVNPGALNWDGISDADKKKINAGLRTLTGFVNNYKYLGIESIIEDKKLTATKKVKEINARVNALHTFRELNGDVDLRMISFFDNSHPELLKPKWGTIHEDYKTGVRKQIMSYQRVLAMSADLHEKEALLGAGVDSFQKLGTYSHTALAMATGLAASQVDAIMASAKQVISLGMHQQQQVREIALANTTATNASNLPPDLVNIFKDMDGYSELFGLNSYCSCAHCKSIFSPAAYFVDLMQYIETNVDGIDASSKISLEKRRKDLWDLKLTCENTNGLVPYLSIVNEVLERQFNVPSNVYTILNEEKRSFHLPFNLPLAEVRTYIQHFGFSLKELLGIVNPDSMHPEVLNLSPAEKIIIHTGDTVNAPMVFGLLSNAMQIDVADFIKATGISRHDLDVLIGIDFIQQEQGYPKIDTEYGTGIQEYYERITNLDDHILDRMARVLRLHKKTGLSLQDISLLLPFIELDGTDAVIKLDIDKLILMVGLQQELGVAVAEAIGLFSDIPQAYMAVLFGDANMNAAGFKAEKQAALMSGLKLSASDLDFIYNNSVIKNNKSAHAWFRYTKLAKRLGYTMPAFNDVLILLDFDVIHPASVSSVLDFVKRVNKLKKLPVSATSLLTLLNGILKLTDETMAERLVDFAGKVSLEDELPLLPAEKENILGVFTGKWKRENLEKYLLVAELFKLSPVQLEALLRDALRPDNQRVFFNAGITITLDVLYNINTYLQLPHADTMGLYNLLEANISGTATPDDVVAFFGLNPSVTKGILATPELNFVSRPVNFISQVLQYVDICTRAGISGKTLADIISGSDEKLKSASRDLRAAFEARYEDKPELEKQLASHTDRLNVMKRDALCSYIMTDKSVPRNFENYDDLYEYFLLDVEMDGCARTSPVLAAISSLQLYVHRCLLNLEAGGAEQAIMYEAARTEWEWRKNYRVWEANRKVFLYPENYIEPGLRDDKSPQFKQLEEELLQQKITIETAENAYKKYLTQFVELSKLVIAGCYAEKESGIYYFFGRTHVDPYQYYYRMYDCVNGIWAPWEKIDMVINSPCVSVLKIMGKLYLFWLEQSQLESTKVNTGNTESNGIDLKITMAYSFLNESGKWLSPQKINGLAYPPVLRFKNKEEVDAFLSVPAQQKVHPRIIEDSLSIEYYYKQKNNAGYLAERDLKRVLDLYENEFIYDQILGGLYSVPFRFQIKQERGNEYVVLSIKDIFYGTKSREDFDIQSKPEIGETDFKMGLIEANKSSIDINGILHLNDQQYLILYGPVALKTIQLTTSLADKLSRALFEKGIDSFLSLEPQRLSEKPLSIQDFLIPFDESDNTLPFDGAYGLYYQELYFHIPFLIANHLNATGKFAEAKYWYEKIFNPAAPEDPSLAVPADRNWQYIRFRGEGMVRLEDILNDEKAIAQYRQDPFNPHAIARLRISAYQKSIVMKYIDNLLDWGDQLFAQDTMESINEATMLYILAKDILGEKPAEAGSCATEDTREFTYEAINDSFADGSEFLIALENLQVTQSTASLLNGKKPAILNINDFNKPVGNKFNPKTPPADSPLMLAFCVLPNETLLGYWDRVADRLFKIRHCMNIAGTVRQLSLFQPPIDPAMLVRARAAGLSVADILGNMGTGVPAYRFAYMIEKAKQFTGTVQGFGSALLSALEKKDAEELMLIRAIHEQNILSLTSEIKKQQIEDARTQLQSLKESKINVENRKNYYATLIESGLTDYEVTQQEARYTAHWITESATVIAAGMAIAGAIPKRIGFSISPGGDETLSVLDGIYAGVKSAASISNAISDLAGLEASHHRREQDWKFQLKLAEQELKQVEQQVIGAEIRLAIAEKDLELHKTQIEQSKELYDFYKGKFTSLGLYDYMSSTLGTLYRQAYNMAREMALKAESAYKFELSRNEAPVFESNNWQADRSGLLAGEKLLLQLQQLEALYIEHNARKYEITQTFSLAQLDGQALNSLRTGNMCTFDIPEFAFDMVYPGQFKRFIKSVRLTIPCVAGPYTNVNAKLSLTENKLRINSAFGSDEANDPNIVKPVCNHGKHIATSNANNDGGVFELNFRDERYLPFEGLGAISEWKLELPAKFKSFDYNTITDVLVHISYTAEEGGEDFRAEVTARLEEDLVAYKLIHVKTEFSNEWYKAKSENKATLTLAIPPKVAPVFFQQDGATMQYKIIQQGSAVPVDFVPATTWEITIPDISSDETYILCEFKSQ